MPHQFCGCKLTPTPLLQFFTSKVYVSLMPSSGVELLILWKCFTQCNHAFTLLVHCNSNMILLVYALISENRLQRLPLSFSLSFIVSYNFSYKPSEITFQLNLLLISQHISTFSTPFMVSVVTGHL